MSFLDFDFDFDNKEGFLKIFKRFCKKVYLDLSTGLSENYKSLS